MTSKGYHHTKEAKAKIALSNSGRIYPTEVRLKESELAKKRLENPEWKQHMQTLVLNAWAKPDAKKRHSESMKKVWQRSGFRERISQNITNLWKTTEFRAKTMKNGVGSNKGKKPSQETINKIRQARLQQVFPTKATKIEKTVNAFLDELHLTYFTNFAIENICQADQAIPELKIAIFEDGCFWHGCEKCGFDKYRIRQKYDIRNSLELQSKGWCVLRFWEHDIKHNPCIIYDAIREAIENG